MDTTSKNLQRTYELTFIVAGTFTDNEAAQVKSDVEALLKKYKASQVEVIDWGKKPLAYIMSHESQKQREGYYTHIVFMMDTDQVQAFERDIFLMTKIMRHLLVLAEQQKDAQAAK